MTRILSYLPKLTTALITLSLGIALVGVYRFAVSQFDSVSFDKPDVLVTMEDPIFTPPQIDESNPEAFDPEGTYTLETERTKGFEDFDSFSISNKKLDVECDAANFGDLTTPTGTVFLNARGNDIADGVILEIKRLKLGSGSIEFSTEGSDDAMYRFSGEFLVKGNFYTLDPEEKVLKGKLSKYEGGKKVSETEVSFTWSIDLSCVC